MHKLLKIFVTIVALYSFVWIVVLAGFGAGMWALGGWLYDWAFGNMFWVPVLLAATGVLCLIEKLWRSKS